MVSASLLVNRLRDNPADADLQTQFLDRYLSHPDDFQIYFDRADVGCYDILTRLFADPNAPVGRLTRLAIAQVSRRHDLTQLPAVAAPLFQALAQDRLCLLVLGETLNTDLSFERVCMRLRKVALSAPALDPAVLPLLAALALQAWNNEYLWEEESAVTAVVESQAGQIAGAVERGHLAAATLPILRWAMYRPLTQLPVADRLAALPLSAVSGELQQLWQRTLLAPAKEAAISSELPSMKSITDDTSQAVRLQYEEHPYPRWVRLSVPQKSILARHRSYDAAFQWPTTDRNKIKMLVAGCGTGQHPLKVAAANPDADVLAIDLSRSSLAYARRMADELEISNVQFIHGDLLHLHESHWQFQHIECIGVLHHLKDQRAAWNAVASVLLPGGTLHIGVYSRVARLLVSHLRKRIAAEAIPPTATAMRNFRDQLLRDPRAAALVAQLSSTNGFYSMSMFRDLLFHVHQYTLSELEEQADGCGLKLLGFELPGSVRLRSDRPRSSPSFDDWRQLESTYSGNLEMLVCTLRRPLASETEIA